MDLYKLPLAEKKALLCSCVFGLDIDIHAVEVAKFSLLIKLIENETSPSVEDEIPILPNLDGNIAFGNALVSEEEMHSIPEAESQRFDIAPFDWKHINNGDLFDVIIGNPPYVSTEGLHSLVPSSEFKIYKKSYKTAYKQFDKYFIFIEQALRKIKSNGYLCYIVPNKFFKIGAGVNLRHLIAQGENLVSLHDFGDTQLFEDKTIYSSILLLSKVPQKRFRYAAIKSAHKLWIGEEVVCAEFSSSHIDKLPWRLTTDRALLELLEGLDKISVPITKYTEIFNGIQTSAERPRPVYWFSSQEVISKNDTHVEIIKDNRHFSIEKEILKPFFKPTKKAEGSLNSYSLLTTDKQIIFPYDCTGKLYSIEQMESKFPGTFSYLKYYYGRLVPKSVSSEGSRDVPNATADTWYQYGRTQALTSFINNPKLIVGILSKEPMYILDTNDILIASGGTAGYCAISSKTDSPYALEYIQAWLSHPITEKIIGMVGSNFEGGFIARGTAVLSSLPFVELDFTDVSQREIHDKVVNLSRKIYEINDNLAQRPAKRIASILLNEKSSLIQAIRDQIEAVYQMGNQRGK